MRNALPKDGAALPDTLTNRASIFACGRHAWTSPPRWRKPRMIFVNSMSDLFHKGCGSPIHRQGVRNDGVGRSTHLPGSDEAQLAHEELPAPPVCRQHSARPHLVRRVGRRSCGERENPAPSDGACGRSLPVYRTAPGPCGRHRSRRYILGYRRRRERPPSAVYATRVGPRCPGSLRTGRSTLLLQTMWWKNPKGRRP